MSNPFIGAVNIVVGGGGYLGAVSINGGVLPPGVIWSFNRVETAINYAVPAGVNFVSVTDTTAPRTITLPNPATYGVNVELVIKDDSNGAGANAITIDGNGSTIDGAASFVINKNGGAVILLCTGSKWLVFASFGMIASGIPAQGGLPVYLYGNGEDGAIDETVSRTLTRDVYATTYRVRAGVNIFTANYRIFATQSITLDDATSSINSDGSSQTGTIIAFQQTPGFYGSGTHQTNAPGYSPGGNGNICQTGRGGNGGNGPAGGGGIAPAPIPTTAADGEPSVQPSLFTGKGNNSGGQFVCGGAGGNGGGGTGPGLGGGISGIGGEGGGTCAVFAPIITNNGRISANGGDGSIGGQTGAPASAGGGGGGGGGKVIAVAGRWVGNLPQVNGGNGGPGVGAGTAGTNGSAGRIYFYIGSV